MKMSYEEICEHYEYPISNITVINISNSPVKVMMNQSAVVEAHYAFLNYLECI